MSDLEKCLAVCRECSDTTRSPCVVPFGTLADHDSWVSAHGAGTGHTIRTVPGWPSPRAAYDQAFGADTTGDHR